MTTSLGKLQATVTKLEKKELRQNERLEELTDERNQLKKKLKELEASIDQKIEKAVVAAVEVVTKHYEEILKEKDQRIFELETRLNINSTNSSLPATKDPLHKKEEKILICNSRQKTDKPKGGQKGHKKSKLMKFKDDEITEKETHEIETCPCCGGHDIEVIDTKERDELDFDIIIKRKRHSFLVGKCRQCGNTVKTKIPEYLHAENNYGPRVKSLATTLNNYGYVSYNRVRKIICGITGGEINPSEGYLTKLQKQASQKLADFVFDVKEKIKKSKLVQWDDTTQAIGDKDKACLRVYSNTLLALYTAHMAKNTEGMDEDGILQNLPSDCTVMHDHLLHNYCDDYKYKNIECNAHITRKLEGITQNTNHQWSADIKNLLEETLAKRKEYAESKKESFEKSFIKSFDEKYDTIIKDGFKEYKEFSHKYEFEREENLLEFLRDYKSEITNWVRDFSLPYSNNLCESLIRFMKIKMKVSGRFQNIEFARYFANIMTYTESCSRCGINKAEALVRLFQNNPYTVEEILEIRKKSQEEKKQSSDCFGVF